MKICIIEPKLQSTNFHITKLIKVIEIENKTPNHQMNESRETLACPVPDVDYPVWRLIAGF